MGTPQLNVTKGSPEVDLGRIVAEIGEAIVVVGADWRVRYCNAAYATIWGGKPDDILGKTPFEYYPAFGRSIFYQLTEECRADGKPKIHIGFSTFAGKWYVTRLFPMDGGIVMMANEASNMVVKQYQLAQEAVKDLLTGLPNKLALIQDLETAIQENHSVELIVLGIDRFKNVNDSLGVALGDMALIEIAARLKGASRPEDRLYRLNGDEFALLVHRTDRYEPWYSAEALLKASRDPIQLAGNVFVLGASAGGVYSSTDGDDAERMLKRASLALRKAKQECRGYLYPFHKSLEQETQHRTQVESELRRALQNDELTIVLQPQGSLVTGEVIGAEALVRWRHPQKGIIMPGEFLPVAQACNLMRDIDVTVLRRAVEAIKRLREVGLEIPISINLSVTSIADPSIPDRIAQELTKAGVTTDLLEVEIPEGELMRDVQLSADTLGRLKAMGIRISIDDFGTGYSSFAYLAKFPVSTLKIDRSFVKDMPIGSTGQKIVRGIVRLAHSLNLQVVAEGAETEQQMTTLKMMHCDVVQGYGYARPMDLDAFITFARGRVSQDTISALSI